MLWHCWLDVRKSRPIIYCFIKIQTGVTFLVSAYLGYLAKEAVNGCLSVKRWWGGIGISWTICILFAPRSRQITTPAPHHSIFTSRSVFLTPNQQHQSTEGVSRSSSLSNGHWRLLNLLYKSQLLSTTHYGHDLLNFVRNSFNSFICEGTWKRYWEISQTPCTALMYINLCSRTSGSKSKRIKAKHK